MLHVLPTISDDLKADAERIVARTPDGKYEFTQKELNDALNRVVHKDNWKNPINATITLLGDAEREIAAIKEATKFICGCECAVNYTAESTLSRPIVSVMAPGYYICVGA